MRITALLGLIAVAAFAAPAFAQTPFVGKWTATAAAPGGDASEIVTVVKNNEGYAITVKLVKPLPAGMPEAAQPTDIVLNGDTFSYKRTVTVPGGGSLLITYTGVISGDTFTGTVAMGDFGKFPYNGVRNKD